MRSHDDDDREHGHPRARDLVIMDDFIYGEPIATSAGSAAQVVASPE